MTNYKGFLNTSQRSALIIDYVEFTFGKKYTPSGMRDLLHRLGLKNYLGEDTYERNGDDLLSKGLFLNMPPWKGSVFLLTNKSRRFSFLAIDELFYNFQND